MSDVSVSISLSRKQQGALYMKSLEQSAEIERLRAQLAAQQEEVAELVSCVKSLAICNDDGATKAGFDSKLEMAHAMIAKFDAPKEKS